MTPTRLRACLAILGWSQRNLALRLQREEGEVRMWARGKRPIPDEAAEWVEAYTAAVQTMPTPPLIFKRNS